MNRETQIELVKKLDASLIDVLISKGRDYGTEDVLSNFKRLAAAAKALNINVQTPGGYARFMVIMKIDRLNNLLTSGKEPNNESIADSYVDAGNYLKLDYCLYEEGKMKIEEEENKVLLDGAEDVDYERTMNNIQGPYQEAVRKSDEFYDEAVKAGAMPKQIPGRNQSIQPGWRGGVLNEELK